MLGKEGEAPPFKDKMLVTVGGVKIGILGLISPELRLLVNPARTETLMFEDPLEAASKAVKALSEAAAAFVVAVVHMRNSEALALARGVDGIDLVIAGGYEGLGNMEDVLTLARLQNGVRLATVPRAGLMLDDGEIPGAE